MITLEILNSCPNEEAHSYLESCCVSSTWINKMINSRPFSSQDELIKKAASIWYDDCSVEDYKEAFTGHPVIGDVDSLREKFSRTKEWAGNEQSKMAEADESTIEALVLANSEYQNKFGYIYIVSASRKSAEDMLAILQTRMSHLENEEIAVAMNEQHKITVIRIGKLIDGLSENAGLQSQITTHALDTSKGRPAKKMVISLLEKTDGDWKPLSVGVTDEDGRISNVLAPGHVLKSGTYVMCFKTQNYYESNNQKGFYPEIEIQFDVSDSSHYHIPLLINPFGFTTYRGS